MNSFDELFLAVKEYCKEQLVPATFNVFIDPLQAVSFEADLAVLRAPSDFLRRFVLERYIPLLTEGFVEVLGFPVQIQIELSLQEDPAANTIPFTPPAAGEFTFDNFVVGSTNKFAHAAAQAVAANPSGAYNPLFIYGGSGLGKTHLLGAIRSEITRSYPSYKIVYVDGETFTNEIISAIRSGSTEMLRQKYRETDILLVDDIQFIGGKESTQEEFFHTFNSLYNAGKQIVLVSDRPPKEIKSLEERLRTRFESGLTADIQPPDFETRIAIIRRKADSLNLDLPDDVAEFIATRLKSNIRQLEGTVKKISAYQAIEGVRPSLGVAQNAIKDILNENQPVPITVDKIINEVARTLSLEPQDIRSRKRNANISLGRNLSIYIVRETTGISLEEIGREFGGRDHSTVTYALTVIREKLEVDTRLRETVEDIIKNVTT